MAAATPKRAPSPARPGRSRSVSRGAPASARRRGASAVPKAPAPPRAAAASTVPKAPAPPRATAAVADTDLWGGSAYSSAAERVLRTTVGPLVLLVATPLFLNLAALAALRHDSSFGAMLAAYPTWGRLLAAAFPAPTPAVAGGVAAFVAFQLALFVGLPGRVFPGVVAPSGFVPRFRRNGPAAYLLTLAAWGAGAYGAQLWAPTVVYDHLLPLMSLLNATALALAVGLLVKAAVAPSTPDHGASDSPLALRLYWGDELYPSLWGVDLKHFIICRLGMMGWAVFTLSFAAAGVRAAGGAVPPALAASAGLNALYVAKFFLAFEVPGYMCGAADIAVDRFGFMLGWGTLAFMPLVHNLQTLHLVQGTGALPLSWPAAGAWLAVGCALIYVNYDADTQRHRVRAAGGKTTVWGAPAVVIRAPYADASGTRHVNLLVACGYLGWVRHFHYLPDMALLVLYCAPAAGLSCALPWTYCVYLSALLVDRCARIDARCAAKYGPAWRAYVARVPWKLVPGVF
jgi:7-dehydrocholesterol reductase